MNMKPYHHRLPEFHRVIKGPDNVDFSIPPFCFQSLSGRIIQCHQSQTLVLYPTVHDDVVPSQCLTLLSAFLSTQRISICKEGDDKDTFFNA